MEENVNNMQENSKIPNGTGPKPTPDAETGRIVVDNSGVSIAKGPQQKGDQK
jgi:hypothetical protein